jgi:hypothetical protein
VTERFACEHCKKTLITIEPGRFTTHAAMSIRATPDGRTWVECSACGRETRIEPERFGVKLT